MSDFHARRRTGIGGSDAAAALGISPWRTPYDLWLEKTGEGEELAPTEPMRWGTLLEPVIADEYSRRTGRGFEPLEEMLRHPGHPWMIAHVDRRIVGEPRLHQGTPTRDGRGWGEPGSDEIPLHYLVQCHHYLIVSDAELADVAVLIGGSDFRLYEVRRDDVIADALITGEAAFWGQVEARDPPAPVNLGDAAARWGKLLAEGAVRAGKDDIAAVEVLRWVRAERAKLEAEEDEAKFHLMQALGERGDALVDDDGTLLATWKLDKGRKGYTVEAREPARRFLLKG